MTQGHHRLHTCDSMPNPSLFSEIPEHEGFNFHDALRVSAQIPDGMACFIIKNNASSQSRVSTPHPLTEIPKKDVASSNSPHPALR